MKYSASGLPFLMATLWAIESDFSKIIGLITADPIEMYTPPSMRLTLSANDKKSRSAAAQAGHAVPGERRHVGNRRQPFGGRPRRGDTLAFRRVGRAEIRSMDAAGDEEHVDPVVDGAADVDSAGIARRQDFFSAQIGDGAGRAPA